MTQLTYKKIRVRDATVHVSRNSRLNDRKISTPCRPIDRKATLGPVLLYKPAPMAGQRTTKRRYIPPAHDPSQSGRQVRLDAGTPCQLGRRGRHHRATTIKKQKHDCSQQHANRKSQRTITTMLLHTEATQPRNQHGRKRSAGATATPLHARRQPQRKR